MNAARPILSNTRPGLCEMPPEDTLARLMAADPAARKPTGSRPMGRPVPGAALLARANAIEALLTDTPQTPAQIAAKLRDAGENATSPETVRTALRKLADEGRAVRRGDSRYSEWSKP